MKKQIDIILPVYKEEEVLPHFNASLFQTINALKDVYCFRVVYVLDRSPDRSYEVLRELALQHAEISIIHLSRRFGHQASLMAGIHHSTGDAVIMMDCDLQHPPSLIPILLDQFEKGYEIVHTVRTYGAKVPLSKRLTSKLFYAIQNAMSPVALRDGAADFRLISRRVLAVLRDQLNEHDPFLRGLFQWIGYSSAWVPFKSSPRQAGVTKYDFSRLLLFFADGVLSFSKVPLRIATFAGLLVSAGSALYGIYLVWVYFSVGSFPRGYASLMLIILVLGGLQLCVLGVIGEYLGRIFDEVKNRPLYLIDEVFPGEGR